MRTSVFSDAQLEGKSWQQLAQMAHKKWKAQTERTPYSIVDLMMQTIGPAQRAGWTGTMSAWCQVIRQPASRRTGEPANPPIIELPDPPTAEPVDDLDLWLEEL